MQEPCEAEKLLVQIESLMSKLSDGLNMCNSEDASLRKLLDQYWEIDCPLGTQDGVPDWCSLVKALSWVGYHAHASMSDLLWYFVLEIKEQ